MVANMTQNKFFFFFFPSEARKEFDTYDKYLEKFNDFYSNVLFKQVEMNDRGSIRSLFDLSFFFGRYVRNNLATITDMTSRIDWPILFPEEDVTIDATAGNIT